MITSDLLEIDPLRDPEIYLAEYIRAVTKTDTTRPSDDWIVKCNGDILRELLE